MQPPGGSYLFPAANPLFPVHGIKAPAAQASVGAPSASSWLENSSFSGTQSASLIDFLLPLLG